MVCWVTVVGGDFVRFPQALWPVDVLYGLMSVMNSTVLGFVFVGKVTALPYSDEPSQDALYGTVVVVGKGFRVRSKLFQLQEVEPLLGRTYDCLSVEGPGKVVSNVVLLTLREREIIVMERWKEIVLFIILQQPYPIPLLR